MSHATSRPELFRLIGLWLLIVLLFTFASLANISFFFIFLEIHSGPYSWFGDRASAMYDLWSLQHFGVGLLTGTLLRAPPMLTREGYFFGVRIIVLAMSWEMVEYLAEIGLLGEAVSNWFGGVHEHKTNRFWGDPAMVYCGSFAARLFHRRSAWVVVLLFCALWLLANLLAPTSSTIQGLLFG